MAHDYKRDAANNFEMVVHLSSQSMHEIII